MLRSRRFWIGTSVSLIFIGLLLWRTDLREVWDAWRHASPGWLLAAIVLYFVSVQVRAFRYRYILLSRISIASWELFPVLAIGYMANNLLPARAGELVRAYILGERHHVSKMFSLGTIAVERLFDGLALIGILICSGVFLGVSGALRDLAIVTVPLFAAAFGVFVGVLASPSRSEAIAVGLVRMAPQRFHQRAEELALAFISGLGSLRHPTLFAIVIVTSGLSWVMEGLVYALVGRALGLHVALGFYLMAAAAANLAITAPSSQGGIGPYEFFAAQTLIFAGTRASVAAAFALAVHALVILPITLVGLFFLWKTHLTLGQAVRREQAAPLVDEPAALPE